MDRSRQWRQKSSEKSPCGETDSSGSLSLHSPRFSDDQNLSDHSNQSVEVTEVGDPVQALYEKLSQALVNIREKEGLIKQHARVAEEAVSGWERAENEVSALRKLKDALNQNNCVLNERVAHLDGALKECLRQLRQAREEQEERIHDAVARKNSEWESKTKLLETEMSELHSELENANKSLLADACSKLEAVEKEKSLLKLQMLLKDGELEARTEERDLSIQAAENASKLYLESMKKLAKLEAECCRLKAAARKSAFLNNHQSMTESSVCADSLVDCGARIENELNHTNMFSAQPKDGITVNVVAPSFEIVMMDDFLEMERVAAACNAAADKGLQHELESVTKGATDLEEDLKRVSADNTYLEIQLKRTGEKLIDLELQLAVANEETEIGNDLCSSKKKLENLAELLDEAEKKAVRFQDELTEANAAKNAVEMRLEDAINMKAEAESRTRVIEVELRTLKSTLITLKEEVEIERKTSKQAAAAACNFLETELSKLRSDTNSQMEEIGVSRAKLRDAEFKRVEAERQVSVMEIKLQSLQSSIVDLQKEIVKERQSSRDAAVKCGNLEAAISRMQQNSEFRLNQDKELEVAAGKYAECQKTIASLTRQLKSLAAFDDFFLESEQVPRPWK